jgi:hypothetical protein
MQKAECRKQKAERTCNDSMPGESSVKFIPTG